VIPFIEKTWFVWWIFATLAVLRWFHLLSSGRGDEGAYESDNSAEEKSCAGPKQIPSGSASSLFT
jgi:hypothetical protein